jgi:UDP-N-acetylmuramate dehydrogenase
MTQKNISLQSFNTFGIAVNAAEFAQVSSIADLQKMLPLIYKNEQPLLILGGGSNLLLTQNWNGLVIKNNIKGIEVVSDNTQFTTLKIGGGEVWHDLVLWSVARNLGGLENMSLIPGTVGAAPIQNIGAYGSELKNVFVSLDALDLQTGKLVVFNKKQCKFGYRESVFKNENKGRFFIVSVTMRLRKNPRTFNIGYGDVAQLATQHGKPTLQSVSNAVIAIRKSKLPDPAELGNSGSFFKNPEIPKIQYNALKVLYPTLPAYDVPDPEMVKIPAGWLIEQAGWKGKRIGNTGAHARQALVLVNYGGATGKEVYNLALTIIDDVFQKYGVRLSPEVNVI